jgi:uncharacterized protein (TIGR02118 family)
VTKLVGALSAAGPAATLTSPHRVLPADPTDAVLASLAERAPRAQPHRALLLAWPRDEAERSAVEAALAAVAPALLRTEEVVHWDELGEPAGEAIVLTYFVRRRPGLSFTDFASHYRERHAPLARTHHPGIARYVQNFRIAAEPGDGGIDAVSELWFRSERDARERFYRDDESRRVIAEDVQRFLDLRAGFAFAARAGPGS